MNDTPGSVVVRLGGPIQSWSAYRAAAAHTTTEPVPTKSGIAGLIGAATGTRDYRSLLDEFTLHVRVDRSNPASMDLQVSSPPEAGTRAHERFARAATIAAGKRTPAPKSYTGGSLPATLADRGILPHSEFIATITTPHAQQWHDALRTPVYMTYLGRQAHPPTFPFALGHTDQPPMELLQHLPTLGAGPLQVWEITDAYLDAGPNTRTLTGHVMPPEVDSRNEQLTWIKEHLT